MFGAQSSWKIEIKRSAAHHSCTMWQEQHKSHQKYTDSTDMLDFSFSAQILGFVPHFYLTNALMGGPSGEWILNPYSRLLRYSTALCSSSSSTSHIAEKGENRETLCAGSNERFFFFFSFAPVCIWQRHLLYVYGCYNAKQLSQGKQG